MEKRITIKNIHPTDTHLQGFDKKESLTDLKSIKSVFFSASLSNSTLNLDILIDNTPITKEGIEGLGFKMIGCDTTEDFIQFKCESVFIESNNNFSIFLIEGEYDTLFRGKLNTIQELKTVLKQVGVL